MTEAGPADRDRRAALARYAVLDTEPEPGYDDIVALASEICATPTALVSLVDQDRQWFKARIGFAVCETTLDRSVCAHALRQRSMLVIPDLTLDPRTKDNPLVTGEPFIRFYAGALLETPDGILLGTLCVIDREPRPQGLSPRQASALQALARQVMHQLELRRALREASEARAAAGASEGRYRTVFESAVDYAIVVMDRRGLITQWNEGATRILGWTPEEMCGGTLDAFFTPKDRADKIPEREMESARLSGRGLDERWHLRKDGTRFWAAGEMMPLRESDGGLSGYVKILRDRTLQREAEGRQQALLELIERLRDAADPAAVVQGAAIVLDRHVAFDRVGYGRVDAAVEFVDIEADRAPDGAPSLVGRHRLADFGALSGPIRRGELLAIDDVGRDPRTAATRLAFEAFAIRSFINVPMVEQGRPVAVFFVHASAVHVWTEHERELVRAIADRTRAAIARLDAEAQQRLLNEELSHRLKNTLTMVQAIASQTLRGVTERDAVLAFEKRILALSKAHDILLRQDGMAARMSTLVEAAIALHAERVRFDVAGPEVVLGPKAALSLTLLLHELATNAVKHGALSSETGRIHVSWTVAERQEGESLSLAWRERGGPTVIEPARTGFGSRLIRMGLAGTREVEQRFRPDGFEADFHALLSTIREM